MDAMKIICSYCRMEMGEKEPLNDPGPTHGICLKCHEYFSEQWKGIDLPEYLEHFDFPIVVVNQDVRIVAYNHPFAKKFLDGEERTNGLLAGEFMECKYARLPEGCGKTVH